MSIRRLLEGNQKNKTLKTFEKYDILDVSLASFSKVWKFHREMELTHLQLL